MRGDRPEIRMTTGPLHLAPEAARIIRDEVDRAGGREVSFLAGIAPDRAIVEPRAVARGNRSAVLAVAEGAARGEVMIHNHPSGNLEPSAADLAVAARIHEEGLGTVIVNNAADRLYVVVEPPAPERIEALDVDDLEEILGPEGPFAATPGYEDREGQRAMLRFVAELFNRGGTGMVEAGTGTGKSLAYLLPAARWAVRNRQRTIVSTNTIHLQEQLVRKDLKTVGALLGERFSWALAKGRGNYVSIRRARLVAESAPTLFPEDRSEELRTLVEWADRTDDGSRSDLPFVPSAELWEEVRSDTDVCMRTECPHFQQCHYQRARRRAAAADLIVVNHALFFSDLDIRIASDNFADAAVLPPANRVIFDEAHHLEDVATARLGAEISRMGALRALARLDRGRKGLLAVVEGLLAGSGESAQADGIRGRIGERIRPAVGRLRQALTELFDGLAEWTGVRVEGRETLLRLGKSEGAIQRASRSGAARESPESLEPADDPMVLAALERALILLGELQRDLDRLVDSLGEDDALPAALQERILDLRSARNRLGSIEQALRRCLHPTRDGNTQVRWIEVRRSGRRGAAQLSLAAAPVEPGAILAEHLFGKRETVVLTSATLAPGGDFSYMRRRLGLASSDPAPGPVAFADPILPPSDLAPASTAIFASPFDHAARSALIVPTDLPGPRSGSRLYNEATARVIGDFAAIADGGLFALFTSHAALGAVASLLRRMGLEARWPLFIQGEDDRFALLQGFRAAGSGLLLGTSSFWEGVDVPGSALRGMVIQKLPFRVPTEPLTEARSEAMTARGEDPFAALMVPDAAMRLKQGIGRLLRTRTDRGAVVLLDDRLLTRRYGRTIRKALPPLPLLQGPWRRMREHLVRFHAAPALPERPPPVNSR